MKVIEHQEQPILQGLGGISTR